MSLASCPAWLFSGHLTCGSPLNPEPDFPRAPACCAAVTARRALGGQAWVQILSPLLPLWEAQFSRLTKGCLKG